MLKGHANRKKAIYEGDCTKAVSSVGTMHI